MYAKCQGISETDVWQHTVANNKVTVERICGVGRYSSTAHEKSAGVCSWVACVKRSLPLCTTQRSQVPKREKSQEKEKGMLDRLGNEEEDWEHGGASITN